MSEASDYKIERLDPAKHRREDFRCESPELTDFLQKRARKEMDARTSACFVLVPVKDSARIIGFYTLSAAEVSTTALPEALTMRLPRYPNLPVTLLGRLARDETFRGKGVGDRLMLDALARALAGSEDVGSIAVITEPKDERADKFYRGFGFHPMADERLFLSMREIVRLLENQ